MPKLKKPNAIFQCVHSSLRSQCWMRLLMWFSNTVKRVVCRMFSLLRLLSRGIGKANVIASQQIWNLLAFLLAPAGSSVCALAMGGFEAVSFYTNPHHRDKCGVELFYLQCFCRYMWVCVSVAFYSNLSFSEYKERTQLGLFVAKLN